LRFSSARAAKARDLLRVPPAGAGSAIGPADGCYFQAVLFRRNKGGVAEARPELREAERLVRKGRRDEAIARLAAAERAERDPEIERRLRRLRNEAGVALRDAAAGGARYPEPAASPPAGEWRVAEVDGADLTPELLRAAVLEYGCLLVRNLVDRDRAEALAEEIDRAFEVRAALEDGEADAEGYYDELQVEPPFFIVGRPWVGESGGLFAGDSPRVMAEMMEAFEDSGIGRVMEGYLGERPVVSAEKCTLRKTTADLPKAWHQDGKFMGDVRALNMWLALSRCGDVAPGLDLVPRRIEEIQESGGEGTIIDIEVTQARADELAGPGGVVRPIFEPGDALLFDHLFLHSTGSDPSMTETRYAIESWFFGPSSFPESYVPMAL
jgi:hypothetical protein